MELTNVFDENFDKVLEYAEAYAPNYDESLKVVLTCAFADLRNLPKLGYPKKVNDVIQPIPLKDYVEKFIDKYLKGYNTRPSVKTGGASATFPDPAVSIAFSTRVKKVPAEDLPKIISGHSLQMSIENLVGDLLEEYLSIRLAEQGWHCCWGSSIDAVDFCHTNGDLLQVKNSDNSENSSSSRVRAHTVIKKWARRKSTKKDTFYWDKLKELTGANNISEADFRNFIKETIEANPNCIVVSNEAQYGK
ncbi:SinI family restriction endonuclease [Flavobacterium sp.]|uniref:SinI family restriction endonuclease n=1 Tax=Flavobacterium sp. TaxID=239 RepID=UPI00391C719E